MFFQHIYDKSLAQGSYLIGCQVTKEAIVIDAKRDIDTYLEIAAQNKLNITHITETHIHADYLCGSRELAAVTGAKMYLSDEGGEGWLYEFPHEGLKDGDVIKVGNLSLKVLHTPGHTPESISFLLTDHPASDDPVMLFTGDFVFVGDVGRPDLLEEAAGIKGTKEEGAKQMYASLKKFEAIPDYVQVWPAHGAGSACGKSLGTVPSSTVGYEKARNWAFSYTDDEKGFVKAILEDQPEPPKYFAMMKHLNKVDRPLLTEVPKHQKLDKEQLQKAMKDGVKVIDTRNKLDFAKGFIPGSINIQGNNSFATWAGWFLNYQEPFVLIAKEDEMEDLTRKLMRIGLDNIYGYYDDVNALGLELEKAELLSKEKLNQILAEDRDEIQLIDVRNLTEYKAGTIADAENLFLGHILNNTDKINQEKELVIFCQGGDRSAIAQSLLMKAGIKKISNYIGGVNEWGAIN